MRSNSLVTADDLVPAGMMCPFCRHEFAVGEEQASFIEAMVEDVPLFVSGICPSCADAIEERGLERCRACVGAGEWRGLQCVVCGGYGEVIVGQEIKYKRPSTDGDTHEA